MSERAPTLSEVVSAAIASRLGEVHTALPGRIVKWDATKQRADVQPLIKRRFEDEEGARQVEELPVITGVPVVFPGGGGYRITFPIRASDVDGDTCLLVFAEASLDAWLSGSGALVDPEVDHGHALMDAVAFVGLRPFGAALSSSPTDEATIGKDTGVQVHFEAGTITVGDKAGSDFIARAQDVLDRLTALQTHFAAVESVITGVPIPEPGNGANSAFQAALQIAIGASPYPTPTSVATTQAKAK